MTAVVAWTQDINGIVEHREGVGPTRDAARAAAAKAIESGGV